MVLSALKNCLNPSENFIDVHIRIFSCIKKGLFFFVSFVVLCKQSQLDGLKLHYHALVMEITRSYKTYII